MTVLMVSYTVRKEAIADLEDGVDTLMAAIREARPEGVRYALCRLPDGVSIVGLLELDDGVDNPLPGLPAARAFQENLVGWVEGTPPAPQPLEVLGSYRFFQ